MRKMKQNWMRAWHCGKGLIYYRLIFRLTNLAFLRVRVIPTEILSIQELYRLKALITLEQVNTTEWSNKKKRSFLVKLVWCCKLSLYANGLVRSMGFIFGDDRNDVPCNSLFWSLIMMYFLWNRGPWFFVYLYTRIAFDRRCISGRR